MSPSLWVLIEKVTQQVIWLVLFTILARMLGPQPYGRFAIVMVFIGFCEFVVVETVVEALIGMEPLQPRHLRTANFCGIVMSILAGGCVYLSAPLIGRLYDDNELIPIFRTLAVLPLISSLSSAPIAVLRLKLRFRPLAIRSTVGLAIGGICAIVMAILGAGVWSLVAQAIVQRAAEVVILWSSTYTRLRMGWSKRHFTDLHRFASPVFVSKSLTFVGSQVPRLILGFFGGPAEVGFFIFAARFPDMLAVITLAPRIIVARSTLREYTPGQAELENAFARLLLTTSFTAFPICAGLAAIMPTLVTTWLDTRWQSSAFAAQLMTLSAMPLLIVYASSSVLWAMKYPKDESKISMAQLVSTTVCVFVAAPFGLNAVCFAMLVRNIGLLPLPLYLISRKCGISIRSVVAAIGPVLTASLSMGCLVALAAKLLEPWLGPLLALPVLIGLGVISYAVLAIALERGETQLFIDSLQSLRTSLLTSHKSIPFRRRI